MRKRKIFTVVEIKNFYRVILFTILTSICIGGVALDVSLLSSELVNRLLKEGNIVKPIIVSTIIFLLLMVIYYFFKHMAQKEIMIIKLGIKRKVFNALLFNSFENSKEKENGDVITNVLDDSESIQELFENDLPPLFENVIVAIIMGAFTFKMDATLFLIVFLLSVLAGVSVFISNKVQGLEERLYSYKDKMNSCIIDYYRLIPIIGSYVNIKELNELLRGYIVEEAQLNKEKEKMHIYFGVLGKFCNIMREFIVIVYGLSFKRMDIGTIIALLNITSFFNEVFCEAGMLYISFSKTAVSAERLSKVFECRREKLDRVDFDVMDGQTLWLDNVTYMYNSNEGINNFSAKISRGKINVLIGAIGAGKSTLGRCIAGITSPQRGDIKVDGISQDKTMLRTRCACVDQEAVIMMGSILENVASFDKVPDTVLVREVLDKVGLGEWVNSLKYGMNTELSSEDLNISGGQKQRIAIARSLYKKADIIMLDEPTSSLDAKSTMSIMKLLRQIALEKIVVVVTHDERIIYSEDDFINCVYVG